MYFNISCNLVIYTNEVYVNNVEHLSNSNYGIYSLSKSIWIIISFLFFRGYFIICLLRDIKVES